MSDKVLITSEDYTELWEQAQEREEALEKMVYVQDGHITINVRYEYHIALNRCDTHQKIIAWVLHLSEKPWMSSDAMVRFIRLAMSENGLEANVPGTA